MHKDDCTEHSLGLLLARRRCDSVPLLGHIHEEFKLPLGVGVVCSTDDDGKRRIGSVRDSERVTSKPRDLHMYIKAGQPERVKQ